MTLLLAAIQLIVLHMVDGRPVRVNPAQVTQLVTPRPNETPGKQISPRVKCVVKTTDSSYVSVAESCDEVRRLMEEAGK